MGLQQGGSPTWLQSPGNEYSLEKYQNVMEVSPTFAECGELRYVSSTFSLSMTSTASHVRTVLYICIGGSPTRLQSPGNEYSLEKYQNVMEVSPTFAECGELRYVSSTFSLSMTSTASHVLTVLYA